MKNVQGRILQTGACRGQSAGPYVMGGEQHSWDGDPGFSRAFLPRVHLLTSETIDLPVLKRGSHLEPSLTDSAMRQRDCEKLGLV